MRLPDWTVGRLFEPRAVISVADLSMALYVCCDRRGVEQRQGAALLAESGRRPKTTRLGTWPLAFSIGKG